MENNHSDTERLDWLGKDGIVRLLVRKLGLSSKDPSYEYQVRLNVGSATEEWRYSDTFTDLREAIDFGIENPLR